ncbi:uncharacterized protein LOC113326700 [Papaver somniferum]|uniref:uncharacterized protein LOC113326700 n=1 Tax=Papaver somniferum TaxID=3469 RepID=UPI000E6FC091|nr:uncharacterized protein LOC113326700 [Papaver somniferum]
MSSEIYSCWMEGSTKVFTPYFRQVAGIGTMAKCNTVLRECEDLCKAQGRIKIWDICQWYTTTTNTEEYACTACCGLAASPPPPSPPPPCLPSPPPPSPPLPSPRDPRDLCPISKISLSTQEESCSACTTANCDRKCMAIGETKVLAGCNRSNFFCSCCCTNSDLTSAERTRRRRSSLFNAA